jgi:hypothetical protein
MTPWKSLLQKICKRPSLIKAYKMNDVWIPDTKGEQHPERNDQVQGYMSDGSHSWFPKPHLQAQRDKDFQNLAVKKFFDFSPVKKLYLNMMDGLSKDPDRHAVKGGKGGKTELRLRHAFKALSGEPGYKISHNGTDKITITAPRHSGNQRNAGQIHTWEYSKNGLKFLN